MMEFHIVNYVRHYSICLMQIFMLDILLLSKGSVSLRGSGVKILEFLGFFVVDSCIVLAGIDLLLITIP